jgi:hypothetical protein
VQHVIMRQLDAEATSDEYRSHPSTFRGEWRPGYGSRLPSSVTTPPSCSPRTTPTIRRPIGVLDVEQDRLFKVWLERCRDEIPAKDERYPHLFPAFPACKVDRGLCSTVVFSDRATNTVSPTALRERSSVPAEPPRSLGPSRCTATKPGPWPRATVSMSLS